MDLDDGDGFADMLDLAKVEPCFAVKLLQYAASANAVRGGDTLQKALIRIGISTAHRLVSEQSSAVIFVPTRDAERSLWLHHIQVAIATESLARAFNSLKIDPDKAHLAGLLHDIGRLVDYQELASSPEAVGSSDYHNPATLLDAEAEILGHHHVAVGISACKHLALPDYVKATVEFHHSKRADRKHLELESRQIVELVKLADEFSVFALRRDPNDLDDFAALCASFLSQDSEFLKPLTPKQTVFNEILEHMLQESEKAYAKLKLGTIKAKC
jgi:putative nucleotidyltransferase with HDIG domain